MERSDMRSNYDKFPTVKVQSQGEVHSGWPAIAEFLGGKLANGPQKVVVECYHGSDVQALEKLLIDHLPESLIINSKTVFKSTEEIDRITFPDVTDDRIFGRITNLDITDFIESEKLDQIRKAIDNAHENTIVYGIGASVIIPEPNVFIYVDMSRWEIQMRMRREEVANIGTENYKLDIARRYKRAYFVDWRICDEIKKNTFAKWDYVIDANKSSVPKLISKSLLDSVLSEAVSQPFRLVPFFDPGPWGGQWMREKLDLGKEAPNFAWGFDCVPEENSILFEIGKEILEFPASNLVFFETSRLLGQVVENRFGAEFPIRFDFLDTIGGGNLSLQVHPLREYIKEAFNMDYTQDESYYILDALEDAVVYLGTKEEVDPTRMITALKEAQQPGKSFPAEEFVATWPAKKHDHFLIPAGTVHCSGNNSMVLEISATPYIFTFKLWDWDRLGLDGLPRPINIERGSKSILWNRTEKWVAEELINQIEPLKQGDGYRAERTGLHETEFIETVRHWFTKKVHHNTHGNLNVLNLVEGREVIIESPTHKFAPMIIHYIETFVIPAAVGEYTIAPYGESVGKECATLKAYVKNETV